MVMIPPLKTAFCGCSVRTGSKVIGWVTIVIGMLQFAVILAIAGMFLVIVFATDDETMGRNALKMLQRSEDPELASNVFMKCVHSFLEMLIGISNPSDPDWVVGQHVKNQIKEYSFTVIFGNGLTIAGQLLFSTLLLIGVYKKKSGYVLFYLIICVVGELWCVVQVLAYIPVLLYSYYNPLPFIAAAIINIVSFFVNLYFTWVIYSFYKQLKSLNFYAGQTLIVPPSSEKKLLHGDIPILVHTVPNDFDYYPKK